MLKRFKQKIIQNDKNYSLHKIVFDIENKLQNFNYNRMKFTGSEKDILDFSKPSMFYWNDPVECIVHYTNRRNYNLKNDKEKMLLINIEKLIEEICTGIQSLKISVFSGLSAARDSDWGTLENYGNNSHIKIKTEADYENCMNETKSKILGVIHHRWTNRYYLRIEDGSHRLAAINRYAIMHNKDTEIKIKVNERKLNINSAKIIFENFVGIITTGKTYSFLTAILEENNIKILFKEDKFIYGKDSLYILWVEKSQDKLLSSIIKFISHLPYDKCYTISSILEKYIILD